MTRSFPPSMGICAPVVAANAGPARVLISRAMSAERISRRSRFFFRYSGTVSP